MRAILILLSILLASASTFAHEVSSDDGSRTCGTARIFENIHKMKGKAAKTTFAKTTNCDPERYYDKVESKKTEHFQVFYTTEGPHATFEEFVDTLAYYLESAYTFHTKNLKMQPPKGDSKSYHYQQPVEGNRYAVEVLDIDLLRNGRTVFGAETCGGCYGLTYPINNSDAEMTQLFIDNDFKYTTASSRKEYMSGANSLCSYPKSEISLVNQLTGDYYSEKWNIAIRITAFHELYHACQLRYMDFSRYWTFWFEGSAAGVEKITSPEIKDYIGFISKIYNIQGIDLNTIYGNESYGMSVLYLYLYNHVQKDFDHSIWENFKKKPGDTFDKQLQKYLKVQKKDADSTFHDFTTKLAFAGNRSAAIPSKEWVDDHEESWPTVNMDEMEKFTVNLQKFSFKYYWGGYPDISNYKGMASAAVFKDGKAEITPITTTNKADYIYSNQKSADSIIWIFSRFTEDEYIKTLPTDPTLRAYPTPWRGEGPLCFTPLPRDKKFIEVRNRRGAIVLHADYEGTTLCIEENELRGKIAPGVYWFRAGNKGKQEKFLIAY